MIETIGWIAIIIIIFLCIYISILLYEQKKSNRLNEILKEANNTLLDGINYRLTELKFNEIQYLKRQLTKLMDDVYIIEHNKEKWITRKCFENTTENSVFGDDGSDGF